MIKVDGLSKSYGGFLALDDITFTCQPGRVTGFLGPNGAGKTTTMRVMVGLTPPTHGRVTIGGHLYHDIPNPGRHVGVLLDARRQHAGRTGREILTIGAQTMGLPESRVDEMLDLVSPHTGGAKRRLRNYSLGMRQRLGIAHALLGDPSVLILDEPANGLDPAGIRWMRGLLKGYADRGGTVLLSSHLLNEVELIADEMILIGHGKIVAQGDKQVAAGDGHQREHVRHVAGRTTSWPGSSRRRASRPRPRVRAACVSRAPTVDVGRAAAEHQIVLTDLRSGRGGLEDLFLELTADAQRDDLDTRRSAGMTATAIEPTPLDISATPPVPMSRLVRVELRKIADTRAGLWLHDLDRGPVPGRGDHLCTSSRPTVRQDYRRHPGHRRSGARLVPADPDHHAGDRRVEPAHRPGDLHPGAPPVPRRDRAKFIAGVALGVAVMVLAAAMAVIGTLFGTLGGELG